MKPLAACLGCLALVFALLSFSPIVQQQARAWEQARSMFQSSLAQTYVQLAGITYELAEDPSFGKNLNWQLENSVNQFLQGLLRPGEVEQIELFTDDCSTSVARARLGQLRASPCRSSENGSDFYWQNRDGVLHLGLSRLLSTPKKKFVVNVETRIGQDWLHTFPHLASLSKRLQLRLALNAETRSLLLREDTHKLAFKSNDWLFRNLPLPPGKLASLVRDIANVLLIYSALFALAALLMVTREKRTGQQARREFTSWCQKLFSGDTMVEPLAAKNPLSPISQFLNDKHLQSQLEIREVAEGKKLALEQVARLETRIRELQGRIKDEAETESLALQINTIGTAFHNRILQTQSSLQDIGDTLKEGIVKNAQALSFLVNQWMKGLQEETPRKFLRHLSEREEPQYGNELLRDLSALSNLSQSLYVQAANLALFVVKNEKRVEKLIKQFLHFHAVTSDSKAFEESRLGVLIQTAQELARQSHDTVTVKFTSDFPEPLAVPPLAIPDVIWTSVFFHLYEVFVAALGTCEIHTCAKQRQEQMFLVFTAHGKSSRENPYEVPTVRKHLSLVEALLAPYRIRLSILPVLGGLAPISLQWQVPEWFATREGDSFAL